MVNITALQDYILQDNRFNNLSSKLLLSLPGSGVSTVLSDIGSKKEHKNFHYIDLLEVGQIFEMKVMKSIAMGLKRSMIEKFIIKEQDFNIDDSNFYTLVTSIKQLISSDRFETSILILDNFDNILGLNKTFFEALRKILECKNSKGASLKLLISSENLILKNDVLENTGLFYKYLFQSVEHVSGFMVEEIVDVLKSYTKNARQSAVNIYQLTGGNPSLVDRMLDVIDVAILEDPSKIISDEYINTVLQDFTLSFNTSHILRTIHKSAKEILMLLIQSNRNLDENLEQVKYLSMTNAITKNAAGHFELSIKFIKELSNIDNQVLASKNSSDEIAGLLINIDSLSTQEFELYELFKKSKGKLIKKEDIAKLIKADPKKPKKADWAVDQLMKRFREKLGDKDAKIIQTVRGRGYRLMV